MAAYFSKNIGIFLQGHFWRWFHTGFTHPLFIGDSLLPALNPLRVLRNGPYWGIGDMGRCDLFWSRRSGRAQARDRGRPTEDRPRAPTLGLVDVAKLRRTWGRAHPCRAQGRRLDLGGPRLAGGRWRREGRWRNVSSARAPPPPERKRLSALCRRRMTD